VYEKVVAVAQVNPQARKLVVDLVQASVGMLTLLPQREEHVQLLATIDRSLNDLGLMDAPRAGVR